MRGGGVDFTDPTTDMKPAPVRLPIQSPLPPPNAGASISKLESLLGRRVCVQCRDDRVVAGQFVCVDNQANIVLKSCDEYRIVRDHGANSADTIESIRIPRLIASIVICGKDIEHLYLESQLAALYDDAL